MSKFSPMILLAAILSVGIAIGSVIPNSGSTASSRKLLEYLNGAKVDLTSDDIRAADREARWGWPTEMNMQIARNEPELFLAGQVAELVVLMERYAGVTDIVAKTEELYQTLKPLLDAKLIFAGSRFNSATAVGKFIGAAMKLRGAPELSRDLAERAVSNYKDLLTELRDAKARHQQPATTAYLFDFLDDLLIGLVEEHLVSKWTPTADVESLAKSYAEALKANHFSVVEGELNLDLSNL